MMKSVHRTIPIFLFLVLLACNLSVKKEVPARKVVVIEKLTEGPSKLKKHKLQQRVTMYVPALKTEEVICGLVPQEKDFICMMGKFSYNTLFLMG